MRKMIALLLLLCSQLGLAGNCTTTAGSLIAYHPVKRIDVPGGVQVHRLKELAYAFRPLASSQSFHVESWERCFESAVEQASTLPPSIEKQYRDSPIGPTKSRLEKTLVRWTYKNGWFSTKGAVDYIVAHINYVTPQKDLFLFNDNGERMVINPRAFSYDLVETFNLYR